MVRPGARVRTRRAASLAAAAAALLAAAPPAGASDPVPPCRVEVEVDPPRALVGQQVHWILRVRRRADVDAMDWGRPPAFPAFRAEWLPGRSGTDVEREQGVAVRRDEERRALFPAREGRLVVPPAQLVCERDGVAHTVPIPPVTVEVSAPPQAGRPEGWQGLVGDVALTSSITPRRVPLGGSVRVALVAQGPANLWDAPSPLEGAFDPEEAELFPVRRRMARDAGARLELRRYFTYDVVPRRTGTLRIPPARLVTWDLERAAWRVVEAPGAEIEVLPEADDAPPGAGPRPDAAPTSPAAGAEGPGPGWIAAGAALALVGGALAFARRRRRGAAAPGADEAAWLARAREAEEAGDLDAAAAALARALRRALARAVPDAGTRATEELFAEARGEAREPVLWLQRLDRLRFAPGGASAAELRALRAEIARWREGGGPERLARGC